MHELKGGSSRHIIYSYHRSTGVTHTHSIPRNCAQNKESEEEREKRRGAKHFFYRRYKYDDDDAATKTILLCFFSSFVLRFCVVVLSNCRECVRVAGEIFPESVRSRDVFKSRNDDDDDEIIFNFLS